MTPLPFYRSRHRILRVAFLCAWIAGCVITQCQIVSASISSNAGSYTSPAGKSLDKEYTAFNSGTPSLSIRIPGGRFETLEDDWDENNRGWMRGSGREYMLFDSRGGSTGKDDDEDDDDADPVLARKQELLSRYYRRSKSTSSRNRFRRSPGFYGSVPTFGRTSSSSSSQPEFFQNVQTWWSNNVVPTLEKMPKIVCRVEPTTTLKLRKTFRPLKTIIRMGADFNTQLGVWQFQSSWEDAIIGGKLTLAGRELQFTKSWQLSVGAVEDLVTRLRFRAAVNLQTFQAYARVGFRTERLSPINVMEGFTILKRLPLDGSGGNVKLEVKANVALPEPELEYSTETQRSLIGNMGDVEVSIDELNLLLDY